MRNLCLDEGILQGYYDGELEPARLEQVASHLSSCEACAAMARDVESEIEMMTGAFAYEMSLSVPSERLRSRIESAVAGIEHTPAVSGLSVGSRLQQWWAGLVPSFSFASPRAVGFASALAFLVLAATVGGILMQRNNSQSDTTLAGIVRSDEEVSFPTLNPISPEVEVAPVSVSRTNRRPVSHRRSNGVVTPGANEMVAQNAHALPGEKNYLQAISSLTEVIEANGESSLQPTLLSDYKRNLAVVDQAITSTQRTARSNPKSTDAAEMLYTAYQTKLDLLTAVSEQSRPLIAER
jgi:anti-sigma factor RsiW